MSEQLTVVVTDHVEPDLDYERAQLDAMGVRLRGNQLRDASEDVLVDAANGAEVLVVNMANLSAGVLERLPACRLVIRHGAGYDNVDVAAAARLGIAVGRIPDYCVEEVAEHALMLLMACQRHLWLQRASLDASAGAAEWDFSGVPAITALGGATLAVLGCGRIGSALLRMTASLGLRRLGVDPNREHTGVDDDGVIWVSLEQALAEADLFSIHAPLDEGTQNLFGASEFRAMKSTAVLVNTARGPIVDLVALDRALRDGEIAAAGIDVYDREPPPADLPLLDNPRAICTPHLAWLSTRSEQRIRDLVVEEVRRFQDGLPPRYPVAPRN